MMTVYISAKPDKIDKAVEHSNVEKVRTFTNIFGQEVIVLTKSNVNVWSGELLYYNVWIV